MCAVLPHVKHALSPLGERPIEPPFFPFPPDLLPGDLQRFWELSLFVFIAAKSGYLARKPRNLLNFHLRLLLEFLDLCFQIAVACLSLRLCSLADQSPLG